jgi:peptide/nickel transport system substrate-binding protein
LPSLACSALLYNFNIKPTSPWGPIFDYGKLEEDGIPRDFFGNMSWGIHIRKAFSYSINFTGFIQQVYSGEATQPATAIVPGLPYHDPAVEGYAFNLTKAAEEFQQVSGLWDTGFTISLPYNEGNLFRITLFNMTKQAIESLNPKFHVIPRQIFWGWPFDVHELPVSTVSWLADYSDPHDFAYAFYYSKGNFASRIDYSNPTMDVLVTAGIATPDGPQRAQVYHDLQLLAIDDCPSVVLVQSFGRHFERTWVCSWYCNPIYSGTYAANLWKWYYTPQAQQDSIPANSTGNLLPYDVNYDGKTNMVDVGAAAACFGAAYGPPIDPRWVYRCDFNNDREIDMKDIGGVAKNFGKISVPWTPS